MSHQLLNEQPQVLDAVSSVCVILTEGLSARAVLRLRRMLQELRFHVLTSDSAVMAQRLCHARGASLLLTANTEQGRQLLARLRHKRAEAAGRGGNPACIALVPEREGPEAVLEMLVAGADECLVWPFGAQTLAQRLRLAMQAA